ncbi:MAG: serine/threonine protein kinase [Mariniblastus sp.]
MTSDRTQHQSSEELQKARDLSLESTRPPAQIPGYKLLRFVGSGAYGEVWTATNLKLGQRVAIKFYTRRSSADVQLLAKEVEKLLALSADSRYVVQVFDVGWSSNPPYYVMDYIEQGSLENRLKNGNSMPAAEAIEMFQEIATGMMLFHSKGILHCDLKPGNILLDQNGKPRVADFGQSRLMSEDTPALGTLFYMAPEQADMEAIPEAGWDVYGLGALLFSMLTGRPPYYSPDIAKQIETTEEIGDRLEKYRDALKSAPAPTAHRTVPGVDRMLADVIDKCIAVDPKKRFTNVQSVLLALRQREVTRARRPLMLLGAIGPLLLMTVVSLFGYYAFNRALEQTKNAVTEKAISSNKFAAKLAARTASEQMADYFRVVGQLARDQQFKDTFDTVIANEELTEMRIQLAKPANYDPDFVEDKETIAVREKFIANELRQKLQKFLRERMANTKHEYPEAASWFVSDRYGNQIASDFGKKERNNTLGKNYSFRSYFTGLGKDLPIDHPSLIHLDKPSLLKRTINQFHDTGKTSSALSPVFVSQQTNRWKVAFAAPIVSYGEIQGIVAVTVDLGNLIDFVNSKDQYTMLVDERAGDFSGPVLQHPAFDAEIDRLTKLYNSQRSKNGLPEDVNYSASLPKDLATLTVNTKPIFEKQYTGFEDPVSTTAIGKKEYNGDTIVWREEVSADVIVVEGSNREENYDVKKQNTGLVVLAVQNYESVTADVTKLGSQLFRLALLAGFFLLMVAVGMWLFVNRLMKESRERMSRAYFPSTDSTGIQSMDTLASGFGPPTASYNPVSIRTDVGQQLKDDKADRE